MPTVIREFTARLIAGYVATYGDPLTITAGAALIIEGLTRARKLAHRAVVVIGHPEYYPRFGFSSARALGLEAPFPVPDEAFMAMLLRPDAGQEILGTVCYPAAFNDV